MSERSWSSSPVVLVLGAVVLLGVGLLVGVLVKGDEEHTADEPLQASSIGNAAHGRQLFVSQGCSNCHTYAGRGGSDAPNLDFMRGRLTAADIANMSGIIWNHVPVMEAAFAEEGIPFPSFEGDQMADLIAYLHGGGPPPNAPKSEGSSEEMHESGDEHGEESGDEHGEESGDEHGEESGEAHGDGEGKNEQGS
jgi:mono/diheme cytochrome c family protein